MYICGGTACATQEVQEEITGYDIQNSTGRTHGKRQDDTENTEEILLANIFQRCNRLLLRMCRMSDIYLTKGTGKTTCTSASN